MPGKHEDRVRRKIDELREAAAAFRQLGAHGQAAAMDARATNLFIGFQQGLELVDDFFEPTLAFDPSLPGAGAPGFVIAQAALGGELPTEEEEEAFFLQLESEVRAIPEKDRQFSDFLLTASTSRILPGEDFYGLNPSTQADWEAKPRTLYAFVNAWIEDNSEDEFRNAADVLNDLVARASIDLLLDAVIALERSAAGAVGGAIEIEDPFLGPSAAPREFRFGPESAEADRQDIHATLLNFTDGGVAARAFLQVTDPIFVDQNPTSAGADTTEIKGDISTPSDEDEIRERLIEASLETGITFDEAKYINENLDLTVGRFLNQQVEGDVRTLRRQFNDWFEVFETLELPVLAEVLRRPQPGQTSLLDPHIAAFLGNVQNVEVKSLLTNAIKKFLRDAYDFDVELRGNKDEFWRVFSTDSAGNSSFVNFRDVIDRELRPKVASMDKTGLWLPAFEASGGDLVSLFIDSGAFRDEGGLEPWLNSLRELDVPDAPPLGTVDDSLNQAVLLQDLFDQSGVLDGLNLLMYDEAFKVAARAISRQFPDLATAFLDPDGVDRVTNFFLGVGEFADEGGLNLVSVTDEAVRNMFRGLHPRGQEFIDKIENNARFGGGTFLSELKRTGFGEGINTLDGWVAFLESTADDFLGEPTNEDLIVDQAIASAVNPRTGNLPLAAQSRAMLAANALLNNLAARSPGETLEEIAASAEFQNRLDDVIEDAALDFWGGNEMAEALMESARGTNEWFRRNPWAVDMNAEDIVQVMLDDPVRVFGESWEQAAPEYAQARQEQLDIEGLAEGNIQLQLEADARREAERAFKQSPAFAELVAGLGVAETQRALDLAGDLLTQRRDLTGEAFADIVESGEFITTLRGLVGEGLTALFSDPFLESVQELFGGVQTFFQAFPGQADVSPGQIIQNILDDPEAFRALAPEGADLTTFEDELAKAQAAEDLTAREEAADIAARERAVSPQAEAIRAFNFQRQQEQLVTADFAPEFERAVRSLAGGARAQGIIAEFGPSLQAEFLRRLTGGERPDLGGELPAVAAAGREAGRERVTEFLREAVTPGFITQSQRELQTRQARFAVPVARQRRRRRATGGISPVTLPDPAATIAGGTS